ncbi:mucin-13 [Ursus maritimus]|uniref:Mucin-13 n=1 Tax=Ursus maritimus TaxID=29073 RepID=A0A384DH63_URSMA|nr:mucin-13 [Ursus maritimus]
MFCLLKLGISVSPATQLNSSTSPSSSSLPTSSAATTTVPSPPNSNTTVPSPPNSTSTSPSPPNSTSTSPNPPNSNSTSPSPPNSNSTSPSPPNSTSTSLSPPNSTSTSPSPPNSTSTSPNPPNSNSTSPSPPNSNSTSPSPPNSTSTSLSPPNSNSTSPSPPNSNSTSPTPPTSTTITPPPSAPTVPVSSAVPDSNATTTETKSTTTVATTNTTSPVSGNSSSAAPSPTTQTNNNGSITTPNTQNNSSEVVTSVTSGNVTSPMISTPKPGPTVPSNPCQGAPCKDGSSCVSLNNTYFCLCSFGYYYNSSTCKKGKLFPGNVIVKVSEASGLGDENSLVYQKLHVEITDFFKNTFDNSDYGQTVIEGVSISPSARSEVRAGDNDVVVEVLNIFIETTKENENSVSETIRKAIQNSMVGITGYTNQSLCDYYGCEKENEQDDCNSGSLCKCKEGMERPNAQIPVCVASAQKCSDTCNADHNKQCLVNKDGTNAECVCLSGYKEDAHGICRECAFGYSGVNCEDQFQLILTIVGSIGGALILCLVIALITIASSKNKNKNIEEQNLIENDFQNLRLQQTTGFSNFGADGSIFPKVRANVSSQPQNPYANQRSMPRPDY